MEVRRETLMNANTARAPTTSVSTIDLPISTWAKRADGVFMAIQKRAIVTQTVSLRAGVTQTVSWRAEVTQTVRLRTAVTQTVRLRTGRLAYPDWQDVSTRAR